MPSETGRAAAVDEALLEDMQVAVDFSRAAYGYAFLSGGMSSIYRYLHMQTLQRSVFDVIGGVSSESNNQAVCAVAGVNMKDVLLAEWRSSTYRPCFLVVLDHRRRRVVLAIRGSLELGDLLTDLHAKPIQVTIGGHTCFAHEGMLRAAAYVHCNSADALSLAASQAPDYPLFVTGHSLGGGVAALLTLLLRQPGGAPAALQANSIRCMTLGTGSSVSLNLAHACEAFVTSVVLSTDVVPRLSYHSVEALLDELIQRSPALSLAAHIRDSVSQMTQNLAPLTSRRATTGSHGAPEQGVQLAEMPASDGWSALAAAVRQGEGWGSVGDGMHGSAGTQLRMFDPSELSARSTEEGGLGSAQTLLEPLHGGSWPATEHELAAGQEDDEAAEDVAQLADGMAAAAPLGGGWSDSPWDRLRRILPKVGSGRPRGADAEGGGGAKDGAAADGPEAEAGAGDDAGEDGAAGAGDERGEPSRVGDQAALLSVHDPLKYIEQRGLTAARSMAASPSPQPGGTSGAEGADAGRPAGGGSRPSLQRPPQSSLSPRMDLEHAPAAVSQLDQDVLQHADAGHAAAVAGQAGAPPPMYPPGRVLWLIPMKRAAGGERDTRGALGGFQPATSTALPANPRRHLAADIFGYSGAGVNLAAGHGAGGTVDLDAASGDWGSVGGPGASGAHEHLDDGVQRGGGRGQQEAGSVGGAVGPGGPPGAQEGEGPLWLRDVSMHSLHSRGSVSSFGSAGVEHLPGAPDPEAQARRASQLPQPILMSAQAAAIAHDVWWAEPDAANGPAGGGPGADQEQQGRGARGGQAAHRQQTADPLVLPVADARQPLQGGAAVQHCGRVEAEGARGRGGQAGAVQSDKLRFVRSANGSGKGEGMASGPSEACCAAQPADGDVCKNGNGGAVGDVQRRPDTAEATGDRLRAGHQPGEPATVAGGGGGDEADAHQVMDARQHGSAAEQAGQEEPHAPPALDRDRRDTAAGTGTDSEPPGASANVEGQEEVGTDAVEEGCRDESVANPTQSEPGSQPLAPDPTGAALPGRAHGSVGELKSQTFVVESSGPLAAAAPDVDVAVVDVTGQRNVFKSLCLSPDMIQDHLPDSYCRCIALLSQKLEVASVATKSEDHES